MLAADPVDFLDLARTQALGGIETPYTLHQPLPPQDLVTAGEATMEIIGDVEKGAVAIGNAGIERQQVRRHRVLVARSLAGFELLDRGRGPDRPVSEQPAANMGARGDAVVAQVERQGEVEQAVVVVAGL